MRLGFCQLNIKHKEIYKNLKTIENMLSDVQADIIVLPELSLTGYYFENKATLTELSQDTINQKIIKKLKSIAQSKQIVIVIGMSEIENESLYNTAYVIDENGVVGKYRKIHLTDNETNFTPGNQIEVIEVKGIKIAIAICFDTWFPEFFRVAVRKGAELICVPANFGGPWTLDVVKVRALENSIPLILSNRVGCEMIQGTNEYFCGGSMILDKSGNVILSAGGEPCLAVADVDVKNISRNESIICKSMDKEREKYKSNIM